MQASSGFVDPLPSIVSTWCAGDSELSTMTTQNERIDKCASHFFRHLSTLSLSLACPHAKQPKRWVNMNASLKN